MDVREACLPKRFYKLVARGVAPEFANYYGVTVLGYQVGTNRVNPSATNLTDV